MAEPQTKKERVLAGRRPPLPGITPMARTMDRVWRWVVAVGGIGVILVVLGILVFVLMESYPLFLDPETRQVGLLDVAGEEGVLAVGSDPYRKIAYAVRAGDVAFFSLEDGSLLKRVAPVEDLQIQSVSRSPGDGYLGLGLDAGYVAAVRVNFRVSFEESKRRIEPELDMESQVRLDAAGGKVVRVDYRNDGSGRSSFAGITDSGRLLLGLLRQRRGLLGGGKKEHFVYDLTEDIEGRPTAVVVDGRGRYALAGTDRGEVYCWDVSDPAMRPRRMQRFQAAEVGQAITALSFLLGDVSVVVGDAEGQVSTWFPVRQPGGQAYRSFQKVHDFRPHPAPVVVISPSERDKQFLTGDAEGGVMLRHMTS
ncbi:MAG: hypothetical protein O2954_08010, partial [bacterium]|nr:hypothetical protein [bacterium]